MKIVFPQLQSVRLRLTLWYGLALSFILIIYTLFVYLLVRNYLFTDLDRKIRQDLETMQELFVNSDASTHPLKDRRGKNVDQWLLEIWNKGELVFSSQSEEKSRLNLPPSDCQSKKIISLSQNTIDFISVRSSCKTILVGGKEYILRATRTQEWIDEELSEISLFMIIGFPLALLVAGFFGYGLAKRALAPVDQMAEKADLITGDNLGERLEVRNPKDELGRLALTFNRTFERIESSFEQMKRFTSDASHELRTSLTVIRTMGEVVLQRRQTEQSYREVISNILEETDRLRQLVESLLTLSRADTGQVQIKLKNENLTELVSEVVQQLSILCEEKGQKILLHLAPHAYSHIDRSIFRHALINLIDNAIKYSAPGSSITINLIQKAEANKNFWLIEVLDEGPVIPEEHRTKIFDRFYRVDPSRQRTQGGTGLGLAIAKWATEINGGRIQLEVYPEQGNSFQILIPV